MKSLVSKNFEKKTVRIYITMKGNNGNNRNNTMTGPNATCRIGIMETPLPATIPDGRPKHWR